MRRVLRSGVSHYMLLGRGMGAYVPYVPPVNSPVAGSVTITGTQTEGQILTANTSGLSDADTLGAFAYQWKAGGANIGGATSSTFTLTAAQVGAAITVLVSYTDGAGNAESVLSAATGPIAAAATGDYTVSPEAGMTATLTDNGAGSYTLSVTAPAAYVGDYPLTQTQLDAGLPIELLAPVITGDGSAPTPFTAQAGLWLTPDNAPANYLRQWFRNDTTVVGSGATYALQTPDDDYQKISYKETAENLNGQVVGSQADAQLVSVPPKPMVQFDGTDALVSTNNMATADISSFLIWASFTASQPTVPQKIFQAVETVAFNPEFEMGIDNTGKVLLFFRSVTNTSNAFYAKSTQSVAEGDIVSVVASFMKSTGAHFVLKINGATAALTSTGQSSVDLSGQFPWTVGAKHAGSNKFLGVMHRLALWPNIGSFVNFNSQTNQEIFFDGNGNPKPYALAIAEFGTPYWQVGENATDFNNLVNAGTGPQFTSKSGVFTDA